MTRFLFTFKLIVLYHKTLVEHGVTGYSLEQCHKDYLEMVVMNLGVPIMCAMRISRQEDDRVETDAEKRQRDLFLGWFLRSASILQDKELDDVLGIKQKS